MWEEHPAYQKAQMKMIGIGLVLLLIAGIVHYVSKRDWHLLRQVLLIAAAFIISLGVFSAAGWLLVQVLTRKRNNKRH